MDTGRRRKMHCFDVLLSSLNTSCIKSESSAMNDALRQMAVSIIYCCNYYCIYYSILTTLVLKLLLCLENIITSTCNFFMWKWLHEIHVRFERVDNEKSGKVKWKLRYLLGHQTGWIAKLSDQVVPLASCSRMLMQISKMCSRKKRITVAQVQISRAAWCIFFYHIVPLSAKML